MQHGVSRSAASALSEEEKAAAEAKKARKLAAYVKGRDVVLAKHRNGELDAAGLEASEALLRAQPDVATFWNYRRRVFLREEEGLEGTEPAEETEAGEKTPEGPETEAEPDESQRKDTPEAQGKAEAKEGRSELVERLQRLYERELVLTFECLGRNPKSYGAWHQRGWVLARIPRPSWAQELKTIAKALQMDERNFHCWDHRRLVCRLAKVAEEEELAFTKAKVDENFSNYSAWHYRRALLPSLRPPTDDPRLPISGDALAEELSYALNAFWTDPADQSTWLYAASLLGPPTRPSDEPLRTLASRHHRDSLLLLTNRALEDGDEEEIFAKSLGASERSCLDEASRRVWSFSGFASGPPPTVPRDLAGLREEVLGGRPPKAVEAALRVLLDNCSQLAAEEPANPWPKHIGVLAMQRLRPAEEGQFQERILAGLAELEGLDLGRKGYYADLRSRELVGQRLLQQLEGEELELSGLGLTALPFAHLLPVLFKRLKAAGNPELGPHLRDLLPSCLELEL